MLSPTGTTVYQALMQNQYYSFISNSFLKSFDNDIYRVRPLVREIIGDPELVVITSEVVEIEPLLYAVDVEAINMEGTFIFIRILKGRMASSKLSAYQHLFGKKKLEMLLHSGTLPKNYVILLFDSDPKGLGVPYYYRLQDKKLEISSDEIPERAHDLTIISVDSTYLREIMPDLFVRKSIV